MRRTSPPGKRMDHEKCSAEVSAGITPSIVANLIGDVYSPFFLDALLKAYCHRRPSDVSLTVRFEVSS